MNAVTLTIILGGVAFFSIILLIVFLFVMGQEGRYHLKRGFSPRGIDLLTYDRMSNSLSPKTIKRSSNFWVDGNKGVYYPLNTIKNPSDAQKTLNTALSKTPHWKGNRRAILLAVEELCFTFTPEFIDLLAEARKASTDNYKDVLNFLKKHFDQSIEKIHFIKPISLQTITDHIDGATPHVIRTSYEEGEASGINKMTKPKQGIQLGTKAKIIIGAGAILAIVILIVVMQQGGVPIPKLPGA